MEGRGIVDYNQPLVQAEWDANEAMVKKLSEILETVKNNPRVDAMVVVGTHVCSSSTPAWQLTMAIQLLHMSIQGMMNMAMTMEREDLNSMIMKLTMVTQALTMLSRRELEMIGKFYTNPATNPPVLDAETDEQVRELFQRMLPPPDGENGEKK